MGSRVRCCRFMPLMLAMAGIALAGCGNAGRTSAGLTSGIGSGQPDSRRAVDSSLDNLSSHDSLLAAHSQRDVDAILKARNGVASKSHSPESGTGPSGPDAEPPTAAPPRKTIVWNDTRPKAGGKEANAPAPSAKPDQSIDVAAAAAKAAAASQPSTTGPVLEPDRMKKLMVDLGRELNSSAGYSDAPLRQLILIAAMSMIDPQRSLNPEAFPDLTEKERELLGKLQTFFADLGKNLDGKGDVEQTIVEAVGKLRESLVKQPVLALPTMALCTRVGGFGDYTPFDHYSFLGQSEQKAILYLEIDDFTSELNQKNQYVTELSQQLTIYSDRDGIPVWKEDWQSAVDISKNKRQDFFTVQVITLPKALSLGKYQLKVRVRDEKSQAEAEGTIPFEMVADPKMAASAAVGK